MFQQGRYRALLIQDVEELLLCLKMAIPEDLLEAFAIYGPTYESVVQWIINEKIETVYLITVERHHHKWDVYRTIMAITEQNIPHFTLDTLVARFIKVPQVFGHQAITTELRGQDLLIWYPR